jgi:molecular chaperone DnaK (HSP70)
MSIPKKDVDDIVLVGGSTWISKIQFLAKEFFNGINPEEAISLTEIP